MRVTLVDFGGTTFSPYSGAPTKYITVTVRVENVGNRAVSPGEWRLRSRAGEEYTRVTPPDVPGQLFDDPLRPGESRTGLIVFSVPADVTMQWLRCGVGGFGTPYLYFDAP